MSEHLAQEFGNADGLEGSPDVAGRPRDPHVAHLLRNLQPSHLLILGATSQSGSRPVSEGHGGRRERRKDGKLRGRTLGSPLPLNQFTIWLST